MIAHWSDLKEARLYRGMGLCLVGSTVLVSGLFIGTRVIRGLSGEPVPIDPGGAAVLFGTTIPLFTLVLRVIVAQDLQPFLKSLIAGVVFAFGTVSFDGDGRTAIALSLFGGLTAMLVVSWVGGRMRGQ